MTVQPFTITPRPSRIGQATAVEQSRAVAEVQAAIVVAQQCPRNPEAAIREMTQSCQQRDLADRAFFRYSRGGSQITGPSVHLARELARCWGNLQFGISEMRRDDEHGQSEMQAYAWDVETNTRNVTTFIVPHKRDTKDGTRTLTDMRDIYENNANNGARRLREVILSTLPTWYVEQAKRLCMDTIENGGGEPLPQRIAKAVDSYEKIGVRRDRLEARIGRPSGDWTAQDVAQLAVIFGSIRNGEVSIDDEFTPSALKVTGADILAARPAPEPPVAPEVVSATSAPQGPSVEVVDVPSTEGQRRKLNEAFNARGVNGDGQTARRKAIVERVIGRAVESTKDLTSAEADLVLSTVQGADAPGWADLTGGDPVAEQAAAEATYQLAEQSHSDAEAEAAQTVEVGPVEVADYDPTGEADWPGAE